MVALARTQSIAPADDEQSAFEADVLKGLSQQRKRLSPNTSITVQKLAGVLRTSERTVWSWLSGGGVRGEVLVDVMNYFGDGFANEVRGIRIETDKELVRLESELARILAERRAR